MKNQVEGKSLGVNAGIEQAYATKLRVLTRAFIRVLGKKIIQFYKQHKNDLLIKPHTAHDADVATALRKFLDNEQFYFSTYFANSVKQYSKDMLKQVDKSSQASVVQSLKSIFKDNAEVFSPVPKGQKEVMNKLVETNVALIRTIPSDFFSHIQHTIMSCLLSGKPISYLHKEIAKLGKTKVRWAELIALDQTRKAYMNINILRMKEAGIKKFRWLHTGGGLHPRLYHKNVLNGQIFDIDKPPVIDPKTNEKGFPGQLPFCKCVMQPIVSLNHSEE